MEETKQILTPRQQELLEKAEIKDKRRCKNCNSLETYALSDGTMVCRRCGHRETPAMPGKESEEN